MMFALLGAIKIGDAVWTGPTAAKEGRKATLVEHKVARGKPPIQDMGDELDNKTLEFFFDETFCDAQLELGKLLAAFDDREPLAYVAGDGAFDGVRWIIEDVDVQTLKTTPYGRPVRIRVCVKLKEVASMSPLSFMGQAATRAASALTSAVSFANIALRRL